MIELWLPPKPAIIRPAPETRNASFMPGMFPAGAIAAGRASLSSIAQQGSTGSTAPSLTAPADIIAGDLLVFADFATITNGVPTAVVPSGFTSINNVFLNALQGCRLILSYKLANGSEASASITGMDGSSDQKSLLVFRGNIPATTLTVGSINGQAINGDPAAQTVTASGGTAPLVVIAAYGSGNPVDPRGFSPAKDGEFSPIVTHYQAWKIYNASPANVSIDMDNESARNALQSCYIQMA